jgi:hypothetical protein
VQLIGYAVTLGTLALILGRGFRKR